MESNNSSLREVLNNIASIQHELANDQTQMLDSDILMQLKGLAARLYLESDIELLSMSFMEEDVPSVEQVPEIVPAFIPDVDEVALAAVVPEVVEVIPEVIPEVVLEVVSEPSVSDVEVNELSVETPLVESESVTEIPAVIEVPAVVPEVVPEPVVSVEPAVFEVPVQAVEPVSVEAPTVDASVSPKVTVESVIGQMPLSRRFEFSNILFGGNMEKMGMFIQQIIDAPNAAGRLDVYDRWYEECQWRRRDESASDMLRMIKRIFAS
ncbi:MAG: hypothetical protein RLZZ548_1070 [Bacteroidota bacterium]